MALTPPLHEADATIVSAGLIQGYRENAKVIPLASQEYTGEVSGKGSTVKVVRLNHVELSDYAPGTPIDASSISDTSVLLTLDQAKYFNLMIDDTWAVSGAGNYLASLAADASVTIAHQLDLAVANTAFTGAGVTDGLGTSGSGLDVSSAGEAYTYLLKMRTSLADAGPDRTAVIPSDYVALLLEDPRFVAANNEVVRNGVIGRAAGFNIIESNVLADATSESKIFAVAHDGAVALAVSINSVERYRPQDQFSDAMKGLVVYGSQVIRPEAVAAGVVSTG